MTNPDANADYFNTLQRNYSGLTGESKRDELIYILENVMGKQVPPHLKAEGAPINNQINELNNLLKRSTASYRAGTSDEARQTMRK